MCMVTIMGNILYVNNYRHLSVWSVFFNALPPIMRFSCIFPYFFLMCVSPILPQVRTVCPNHGTSLSQRPIGVDIIIHMSIQTVYATYSGEMGTDCQ